MPSPSFAARTVSPPTPQEGPASRGPAFRAGAAAAAASLGAVVAPVLLGWVAATTSTVAWTQALGVGAAGWFLGHGAPVRADTVDVSLVPLLLLAVVAGSAVWGARRAFRAMRAHGTEVVLGLRRDVLDTATGFVGGYASVGAAALLATLLGPARPHPVWALVAVIVVAVLAAVVGIALGVDGGWSAAAPEPAARLSGAVPQWMRRAVRPAWQGGVLLGLVALVIVVVRVAGSGSDIGRLTDALDPGWAGLAVLALGQAALLPNLVLWALAWLSGPGFALGAGSSVTLTAAEPGLLPMVPILAALPSGGALPMWVRAAPLAVVAVGVAIGWRASAAADDAPWQQQLGTGALAAALVGAAVGVLTALGSGAVGAAALADVGADGARVGLVVAAELAVGAMGGSAGRPSRVGPGRRPRRIGT